LACDGVFDRLENKDLVHTIWQSVIPGSYNANVVQKNKSEDLKHHLAG